MPSNLKSAVLSFYPYEPAALEFVNIINKIVFNNGLPLYLLNVIRDGLGEPLLDYEKEMGILEQRKKTIKTTLAPYLSQTLFSSNQSSLDSSNPLSLASSLVPTNDEPITNLISEYDDSNAISI